MKSRERESAISSKRERKRGGDRVKAPTMIVDDDARVASVFRRNRLSQCQLGSFETFILRTKYDEHAFGHTHCLSFSPFLSDVYPVRRAGPARRREEENGECRFFSGEGAARGPGNSKIVTPVFVAEADARARQLRPQRDIIGRRRARTFVRTRAPSCHYSGGNDGQIECRGTRRRGRKGCATSRVSVWTRETEDVRGYVRERCRREG